MKKNVPLRIPSLFFSRLSSKSFVFCVLMFSYSMNINAQCDPVNTNNPSQTTECNAQTTQSGCEGVVNGGNQICVWNGPTAPVELSSFKFEQQRNGIKLMWTTASEVNNRGFEVQHTTNGSDWTTVDFVQGFGNAISTKHYELDVQPRDGKNYYRLKQMDFDGQFELSQIIVVEIKNGAINSSVYPNPTKDGLINLDYHSSDESELTVQVFDLMGKMLYQLQEVTSNGLNRYQLDLSALSSGTYLITTSKGDQIGHHKLIIK